MYQPQSNFGFGGQQQQFGQQAGAQYRGMQRTFQPTGYVQSSYNPNASFSQSYAQNPQAASYHTASYRGNQSGHDQYLRADSTQPNASSAFGGQQAIQSTFAQPQANQAFGQSFSQNFSQSTAFQQQPQSAQAYHLANYRGNQQDHDQYLRADSTQPNASAAFGGQQASQSAFAQPQAGQAYGQSFSQSTAFQQQPQSAQAYHTASYRGNQSGHDQYLRADSVQPTQNQAQFFGR
ncbi:hypothetical protein DUZ99_04145 [Xylanibacillus composti]|uniref:Uncharacterized protein n=1 Tax=Xylanibacillus composti TaxID=1572762 RepID=A0A8J4H2N0_9BACL|nr:hypothetical protein [Xylanibacillus composti]MDT9724178.1 hypothetical protein [Xylanibacillus composti]GIQ68307.1 hypothetical protein XYCOK13_11310 [Xylanibacillus composti]